jgi:hypothetical protein
MVKHLPRLWKAKALGLVLSITPYLHKVRASIKQKIFENHISDKKLIFRINF